MWKSLIRWLKSNTSPKNTENALSFKELSTLPAEFRPIDNTPFHVAGTPDEGFCVTMGGYRLTDMYPTAKEAEQKLETHKWTIIMVLMESMLHYKGLNKLPKAAELPKEPEIPEDIKEQVKHVLNKA